MHTQATATANNEGVIRILDHAELMGRKAVLHANKPDFSDVKTLAGFIHADRAEDGQPSTLTVGDQDALALDRAGYVLVLVCII